MYMYEGQTFYVVQIRELLYYILVYIYRYIVHHFSQSDITGILLTIFLLSDSAS